MTRRIAIIGSGVAGLVATRTLHRHHDVTLYEAQDRLGGHAQTVTVDDGGRTLAIDTGFIVYNERTYPLFSALLAELGVATQPSEMSFGVDCRRCGIAYSSRGLAGLFARPAQVVTPGIYRMAADIVRFNRWARREAAAPDVTDETIGDLLRRSPYGPELARHYLVPMASAIWSATPGEATTLPLRFFVSFFRNHGLLQVSGHPPWRTVTGGSRRYVDALSRPFRDRIRMRAPVGAVRRSPAGVAIHTADAGWERYDDVVIATHADQALALLETPTPDEAAALAAIPSRRNVALLHTDDRVLPVARRAWASWNYHLDDCRAHDGPLSMTYDLTRLQRLPTDTRYCVTLNDAGRVDPAAVRARLTYDHPVYTVAGLRARATIRATNGQQHTFFCGAYLGNGFHEDGVRTGRAVGALIDQRRAAA